MARASARFSRGEIEAMSASDIKYILKGMGVKGITVKKDDLVRLLSEYNGSGMAKGLLRELSTKSKEWLSRFSMPRLRAVADLLGIPGRGLGDLC